MVKKEIDKIEVDKVLKEESRSLPLYPKVLNKFGIEAQRWILIEEMGEVLQSFSHERRNRCIKSRVASELIDLQVSLNSVRRYYVSDYEWRVKMNIAEDRLRRLLNDQNL